MLLLLILLLLFLSLQVIDKTDIWTTEKIPISYIEINTGSPTRKLGVIFQSRVYMDKHAACQH